MQSDSSATLLGGSMPMTLDHLFRRDPAGGIHALFDGRRVSFSFNTRVAIRKACDVLGLKPGDEILVPSWNCGSEIDPLRHAGLEISFYPVDRRAKINISAVAALITSRTKAVYVTHYFGFLQPALSDIRKLCDAHGLVLIEDCALSLLSGAAPAAGTTGDVALFCFYKFFPSLAGGALVINNSRFSDMGLFHRSIPIKFTAKPILRASLDTVFGARRINAFHSWLRPNKNKKTIPARSGLPEMPVHYYFDPRLQNAKSSTFTNLALRSFDVASAIAARRANYLTYLELLASVPGIIPLFQDLDDQTCPHSMPVLTKNRDELANALAAQGINATPWWAGYNQYLNWDAFPDARYLKNNVLSLPLHQFLSKIDIQHVVDQLSMNIDVMIQSR